MQKGGTCPAPHACLATASLHRRATITSVLGRVSAYLAGLARVLFWGDVLVTVDLCLLKNWAPPLPTCLSVPGWEHPVALAGGDHQRAPAPLISIRPRCSHCFGDCARHCLATTEQNYNSSPGARACFLRVCRHTSTRLLPARGQGGWQGHPVLLPPPPNLARCKGEERPRDEEEERALVV